MLDQSAVADDIFLNGSSTLNRLWHNRHSHNLWLLLEGRILWRHAGQMSLGLLPVYLRGGEIGYLLVQRGRRETTDTVFEDVRYVVSNWNT